MIVTEGPLSYTIQRNDDGKWVAYVWMDNLPGEVQADAAARFMIDAVIEHIERGNSPDGATASTQAVN